MNVRIGIAAAALALFSLACGGSPPAPSLTVSPSTLTLTSGSTPAGFTATLSGSSATISWSLAGPGSISVTTGTSTSYTPPATLTASTTATLTATAGTLTAGATITINPPAVNLTVSPQTLTINAGRSSTTFTATQTGASNPIAWALTGPGTITSTSGATTSYSPPLSVASTMTATLTATAGALTAPATITINVPPPISVTGSIVYEDNSPVTGANVTIGTQPPVITDANGSFTIANVTAPYDVIATAAKNAVVYKQLTLTSPTIVFPISNPTPLKTGTVTGSVSPNTLLTTAGVETVVGWGSPQTIIDPVFTSFTANPYSLNGADNFLNWFGPTSITGTVHVIQEQLDTASIYPTGFPGYGLSAGVVLAASGTASVPTINMTSIAGSPMAVVVTAPTTYNYYDFSTVNATFSDGTVLQLADTLVFTPPDAGPTSFTTETPLGINATIQVIESAEADIPVYVVSNTVVSGIVPGATDAGITVLAGSTWGSPSDAAMLITNTTVFTWTSFEGGINFVVFSPSAANAATQPTYYVFVDTTSTTIPDLGTEGLGLPTGAQPYTWRIFGVGPFANLDAFASGNFLSPLTSSVDSDFFIQTAPPNLPLYNYSNTWQSRSFTTQ